MKLTTNIKYWEGYLPTPRSRKERFRLVEETIKVEIPELSKEDLRPAFIVHSAVNDDQTYYLCNENLYVEVSPDRLNDKHNCKTALESLISDMEFRTWVSTDTRKVIAIDEAEKYISNYMVADGVLYRRAFEPLYSINTYGLGGNHGGTSLGITSGDPASYVVRYCYSALDSVLAVKEAKEVALGRGDTDYVQYIKADIDVLLPEACKFPRRITDPLDAVLKEVAHGKPVEIFSCCHRFRVINAAPFDSEEGRCILAFLDCGLRVKLPRLKDGRCARSWFINRSDKGVLQIEINWEFLDREYLDI